MWNCVVVSSQKIPPPGSGALMAFILRILSRFELSPESLKTEEQAIQTYHVIIEAFKHAYAKRTSLGDPEDETVTDIVDKVRNVDF